MSNDPDKWHIGWEWHANMWYVEPPVDMIELETKWFNTRDEAWAWVDEQIRTQPTLSSPVEGPVQLTTGVRNDPDTVVAVVPQYVPRARRTEVREVEATFHTDLPPHLSEYQRRVGLK